MNEKRGGFFQVPEFQGDFKSSPVLFSLSTKHPKLLSHPFPSFHEESDEASGA